jgi:xylulokinase
MNARVTLGIDIGSTALKLIALDRDRGIVAQIQRPHHLHTPHPGWSEEDPEEWWRSTADALRELTGIVSPETIAGIGVSGMVPALILVDTAGRPVRASIQQNDSRAFVEVAALRSAVDPDEFFATTGGVPNQQNIHPRWLWLKHHEPGAVASADKICGSYDFIVHQLTGVWSLEENWAAESGLYDVHRHRWHLPYLEQAGIAPSQLPPVHLPTQVVGEITERVAMLTGLRSGTPVVAGSADHVAAALAAGVIQDGDTLLKFGGAGDILYCSELPVPDPHFYFDYHDIPGLTLINGCMASSGALVEWFSRDLAGGAPPATLDREAEAVPPGSGGIVALPYFLGEKTPIFDPQARGVFAGVMLHHTRAHLYRALLESVCYGFAHHLAVLNEAGRTIRRICAADGGSRSRLWMQIAADVVGQPLEIVGGEAASALGTAFVAAMGVELFDNWHSIDRFLALGEIYHPQDDASAIYRRGLALYRDLYLRLKPLLADLGHLEAAAEEKIDFQY